jgi:hypothetical protein
MNLSVTRPFSIFPLKGHLKNGLVSELQVIPLIIRKKFLNNGEQIIHGIHSIIGIKLDKY